MNQKQKGKQKVMWAIRLEPELLELLKLKRKEKGKAFPGWIRAKMQETLREK